MTEPTPPKEERPDIRYRRIDRRNTKIKIGVMAAIVVALLVMMEYGMDGKSLLAGYLIGWTAAFFMDSLDRSNPIQEDF